MTPRICCIGDLVTDVVVRIGQQPEKGTDTPAEIVMTRGGSAAGVAASVSASGGVGRFVGNVGNDRAGEDLVENLKARGVETYTTMSGTSGTIVVLVDETGERSFLTDRGAAAELRSVPVGALNDVDLVHVPAYSFLEGPLADTTQELIERAGELGIPVSISTSSVASLRDYGRDRFLELLSTISPSYVIANSGECQFLMGAVEIIPGAGHTVVTNGAGPTSLLCADGIVVEVQPPAAEVRDSTGAGDAFTGAFLVAQLQGVGFEESLQRGHEVAARVLSSAGSQLS